MPAVDVKQLRDSQPPPTDVRGRYDARLRCEDVATFGEQLEELLVVVRRAMADEKVLDMLYAGLDRTPSVALDRMVEVLRAEEEDREVAAQEARRSA